MHLLMFIKVFIVCASVLVIDGWVNGVVEGVVE